MMFSNLIHSFQAFPPANIIFTGIAVLLLVRIFRHSFARSAFDTLNLRQLKMSALAETISSTFLTGSKDSSNGLRFTLGSPRLRL